MMRKWLLTQTFGFTVALLLGLTLAAAAQREEGDEAKPKAKSADAAAPLQDPADKSKDDEAPRKPDAESQATEADAKAAAKVDAKPAGDKANKGDRPDTAARSDDDKPSRDNADKPAAKKSDRPRDKKGERRPDGAKADPPRDNPRAAEAADDKKSEDAPARERPRRDDAASRGDRGQDGLGIGVEGGGPRGMNVVSIEEESIAAKAGLKQDDRIVSVDGWSFRNPRHLQAYLSNQAGRRVPFVVERNGERITIQIETPQPQDGAWLGVYLREPEEENSEGARVTQVYPGGPAARAGIRAGDVIVKLKDQKVTGPEELVDAIDKLEPKAEAEITVLRGDREVQVTATLGSRLGMLVRGQGGPEERRGGLDLEGLGNFPEIGLPGDQFRRMAEQQRRLEDALNELRDEVKQLREKLNDKQ